MILKNWTIATEKLGRNNIAYIIQLVCCIAWVVSFMYPINHQMNCIEVLLAKGLGSLPFNYFLLHLFSLKLDLHDAHTFKYLNRIVALNLQCFLFISLSQLYLSIPLVHTIGSSCIIFVSLMDYFIYKTKITTNAKVAIVLCLIGVFLGANNKWLNGNLEISEQLYPISAINASLLCLALFFATNLNCYGIVIIK